MILYRITKTRALFHDTKIFHCILKRIELNKVRNSDSKMDSQIPFAPSPRSTDHQRGWTWLTKMDIVDEDGHSRGLPQPSGFSLRLEQSEDISFSHGSLHITNDGTIRVIDELNANLGTLTLGTGSAQHLGDLGQLRLIHLENRMGVILTNEILNKLKLLNYKLPPC